MPPDEKGGTPEVQAAPTPQLSPLLAKVMERIGGIVMEHHSFRGDDSIHLSREHLVEAMIVLRDDPAFAFDFLADVTAVDYFGQPDGFETKLSVWDENSATVRRRPQRRHELVLPPRGPHPRFALVYHLASTSLFHRLRIKCRVPEEDPSIPTLSSLWPSADWMERETYDMYGIIFTGHPDLRRIYLYEEFEGHPLRKDYHKHHEQPIQLYVGPGAKEPRRPN